MKAFFDLDGTLVDITERWYALHKDMATKYELPVLERETYIAKKREGIPEETIMAGVSTNTAEIKNYCAERITHIEDPKYLVCDRLYPDILHVLDVWKKQHSLVLVTARHDKNALSQELERLGIADYFSSVVATDGEDKTSALSKFPQEELQSAPFISDSHKDYHVGLTLGMHSIIVGYGCRTQEFISSKGIQNVVSAPEELVAMA